MSQTKDISVGLAGARGYVGRELLALLEAHPRFRVDHLGSRQLEGQALSDLIDGGRDDIRFEALRENDIKDRPCDAWILALPNGLSAPWVAEIDTHAPNTVVLDLSGDNRFDDDWHYGLPEIDSEAPEGNSKRISNPGCYATAMQLAIWPMLTRIKGTPRCFGVSGYSGAGTNPSDKNDPAVLKDNFLPYAPIGHLHEREVSRHLDHHVHFMPHVAAYFRGILMTVDMELKAPMTAAEVLTFYRQSYSFEPLIHVQPDAPDMRDVREKHGAVLGGFAVDDKGERLVVYCALDNLLKGAATQAVQNLNIAFGLDAMTGIPQFS